jgi:hypothetical protein
MPENGPDLERRTWPPSCKETTVEEEESPAMDKLHANHTPEPESVPYAPTPDSVAAARAAQARERAEFTRTTGVHLDRDGQLSRSSLRVHPLRSRKH